MKFLVTGATGFIGRECCRQIVADGGELLALSCHGGDWRPGSATRRHDLTSPVPPELLRDVDAIVHCAGVAHQRAPAAVYEQINERATQALAEAAASAGVKRFVFLSSVKAMGPAADDRPRIEGDLREPTDPYGLSKRRAEQALAQRCGDAGMAIAILRPALVYGPGVGGNLGALARAVRRGLPRPPQAGRRSMIARSDLARLTLDLARGCPPGVHTWIAVDGEDYSTRRLYDALRSASHASAGRDWLPAPAWRLACGVLDLIGRGEGRSFDKLFGSERYSCAALQSQFGWRATRRFEDDAADIMAAVT